MSRKYCNRLVNLVIRMFRFAASQEMLEITVSMQLRSLEPLRAGQSKAIEKKRRQAVSLEVVRKTARFLSPVVRAMVRIQVATGMRSSEICNIRPIDIDRSGEVWLYRLQTHKTAYQGVDKIVPIVKDAKDALIDYLNRPEDAYCFSPAETMAWSRAKQSAQRVGYGSYKKPIDDPKRKPRAQYNASSYCRAIRNAAEKAGVPSWHPHQVRHRNAEDVSASKSVDHSQALLGHANRSMTEHYAKPVRNLARAIEAAKAAPQLGELE
jgi:integrase